MVIIATILQSHLMYYFQKKFQATPPYLIWKSKKKTVMEWSGKTVKNNRLDRTFTVKKVKSAFAHMGSYKSAGPDGFKPIIMKHFGPKALTCINNIFQANIFNWIHSN